MKNSKILAAASALVISTALLAACGDDDSTDSAAPESAAHSNTEGVDESALDTGDYPTEPAEEFGKPTAEQIGDIEGQRLAEYSILPFEADPAFTEGGQFPVPVLRSLSNISGLLPENATEIFGEAPINAGYTVGGATKSTDGSDQSNYQHSVLSFATADETGRIANDLHNADVTASTEGPATAEQVPGQPGTLVTSTPQGEGDSADVRVRAFTAHGPYLFIDQFIVPNDQKDKALESIGRAVDQQVPLADQFPRTPNSDEPGGGEESWPDIDQDKILIYALRDEAEDPALLGADGSVFGPRGTAGLRLNSDVWLDLLQEVGAEHTAISATNVFRAADDAGAEKIVNEYRREFEEHGAAEVEGPQGLPDALCVDDSSSLSPKKCIIQVGRYVAEIPEMQSDTDVEDMKQRTAAQYMILSKADQKQPN